MIQPHPNQPRSQTQTGLKRWLSLGTTLMISVFSILPAQAQTLSEKILAMEQGLEQEFEGYFGADLAEVTQAPEEIAQTLQRLAQETGTQPAVIWVIPRETELHLVLMMPGGTPIVRDLKDVPANHIREVVDAFHLEIHGAPNPGNLTAAQQLYDWIVGTFEAEYLQPQGIDTILFCLGNGVRSIPLAALSDGDQFLIEKYSLTRIPAFNLIQTDYVDLHRGKILAMGASEFREQNPLPAVPTELSNVLWGLKSARPADAQWQGRSFLNQQFTLANLKLLIGAQSPNIVHLATHAVFRSGRPENSYIQFWDTRLSLTEMRGINWGTTQPLEILVLSACRTAIGDDEAELGFAGLALEAGVKSAVASIWNVSDEGTLALMSEFYQQLGTTSTKAEALRQAQLLMLRGDVRIEADQIHLSRGNVPLPAELSTTATPDLSSPYYWAAFTLISSPW